MCPLGRHPLSYDQIIDSTIKEIFFTDKELSWYEFMDRLQNKIKSSRHTIRRLTNRLIEKDVLKYHPEKGTLSIKGVGVKCQK